LICGCHDAPMTSIPLRRWLLVLFAGTVLVSTAPVPAVAAVPDPVRALKAQFAAGHGVRVAERVTGSAVKFNGQVGFGAGGMTAVDVRGTNYTVSGRRVIIVHGIIYAKTGKRWTRSGDTSVSPEVVFAQHTIVFNPVALQELLATTRSKRLVDGGSTTLYQGVLTYAAEAPPAVGRDGVTRGAKDVKMHWKLWVDERGLARRLVSVVQPRAGSAQRVIRTRFKDWGMPVTIKAPPEAL
jgi:hypothetical protein